MTDEELFAAGMLAETDRRLLATVLIRAASDGCPVEDITNLLDNHDRDSLVSLVVTLCAMFSGALDAIGVTDSYLTMLRDRSLDVRNSVTPPGAQ